MKNLVFAVHRFRRLAVLVLGGLIACVAFAAEPLKVGFVYVSPVSDAGWTYQHDQGRKQMVAELGERVQTRFVDKVAEGPEAERVIRDLASQGYQLIFATSFGFMEPTLRVARDFPDVTFEHASGYKLAGNMANYNARFYEGRFLAGMAAGAISKTNRLGYVAALPIPEVIQGINAFMLGARQTNPSAELSVLWTNSWYDPGRETSAATALIDLGADVLTHHTDSSAVPRAAEAAGKWVVGYHSDMRAAAPKHHLVSVTHHWGQYYTDRVKAKLAGQWQSQSVWGGMQDGFVRIDGLSNQLEPAVAALIEEAAELIRNGTRHPFAGPVTDNTGKERIVAGKPPSDELISRMDWFVAGVNASLPGR
ncbi:MAG: BMP family ABC transporter substrate-binding protein [Burkholderiaceae bacterium]